MKTKMTKAEKNWVLYDVGNSAFVLLVSTIMPIYFNYLAGNAGLSSVNYLAYWGYAASAATIIVALLGPVFGTLADTKGLKKPIFTATMLIGGIGCLALGFARQWMIFLLIYIIAKTGFQAASFSMIRCLVMSQPKTGWIMYLHKGMPGAISEVVCHLYYAWELCSAQRRLESVWRWQ